MTTLGPGRRLGVWLQGCTLACRGCMSRHTWDPAGGRRVDVSEVLALWRRALAEGAEGLTVSGGEPLAQPTALAWLLAGAHALRAEATARHGGAAGRRVDLLLYTGHTTAEIVADTARLLAVRHADALITGRFDARAPTDLIWRGSANQRLIPLTPLGHERYDPYLDSAAAGPTLQVASASPASAEAGLVVYGVPRRGELAALQRRLARAGTHLTRPSWRA